MSAAPLAASNSSDSQIDRDSANAIMKTPKSATAERNSRPARRGGARHAGHIHQAVEFAFELLNRGVDAARIRQIDLDVTGNRRGRDVAVEAVDLGAGLVIGGERVEAEAREQE